MENKKEHKSEQSESNNHIWGIIKKQIRKHKKATKQKQTYGKNADRTKQKRNNQTTTNRWK